VNIIGGFSKGWERMAEARERPVSKSVVFMFSGQGSQYSQMGGELFHTNPAFRRWMVHLDGTVRKLAGRSILPYLYDGQKGRADTFDPALYSSLSIFLVEYALVQVLLEKGIKPDYLLGASLGEYTAAAVANVLPYEEVIAILLKKAEIFEACCPEGGMLAILHDPALYRNVPLIRENSELASLNFPSHFVVAGWRRNLQIIQGYLREQVISYLPLPVSYAFHSSLIEACAAPYTQYLSLQSYRPPSIPLISCTRAGIVKEVRPDYLWEVIRQPILFQKTIEELEMVKECVYLDLGPSGTLATFVKYNLARDSASECLPILTPFGQDARNLEQCEAYFRNKPSFPLPLFGKEGLGEI